MPAEQQPLHHIEDVPGCSQPGDHMTSRATDDVNDDGEEHTHEAGEDPERRQAHGRQRQE